MPERDYRTTTGDHTAPVCPDCGGEVVTRTSALLPGPDGPARPTVAHDPRCPVEVYRHRLFASDRRWLDAHPGEERRRHLHDAERFDMATALGKVVSRAGGHHVNRWLAHPDAEQLMLRILGTTLVVAAVAELVNVSAAVGAFLVGLTLTGDAAERARAVLSPLRDLFAAAFFLSIGLAVNVLDLVPVLPAALALAIVGVGTKILTGRYAAARDGAGERGRMRAGTALIARGEFSILIITLAGASQPVLGSLVTTYVLILATTGPLLTRWTGRTTG
jgi:Sodium/hydrogen exchanger family